MTTLHRIRAILLSAACAGLFWTACLAEETKASTPAVGQGQPVQEKQEPAKKDKKKKSKPAKPADKAAAAEAKPAAAPAAEEEKAAPTQAAPAAPAAPPATGTSPAAPVPAAPPPGAPPFGQSPAQPPPANPPTGAPPTGTTPAGSPPAGSTAPQAGGEKKPTSFQQYLKENQLPSRLEGKAKLVLKKVEPQEGTVYKYDIFVDLTGVTFVIRDTERIPAVLGAYTLGVKYDPTRVKLVDMNPGQTAEFAKKPIFTNLEKANAEGLVRFSAVHTNSRTPTGLVSVAQAVLDVQDPAAAASIQLYGDSLSTSILFYPDKKLVGPFTIPFEGLQLPRRTVVPAAPAPAHKPAEPPAQPTPAGKQEPKKQ